MNTLLQAVVIGRRLTIGSVRISKYGFAVSPVHSGSN